MSATDESGEGAPKEHAVAGESPASTRTLPAFLRPLFWDCDFAMLDWEANRPFIIGRVLASGDWEHIGWLRQTAGDEVIRAYLLQTRGRTLSRRQLRFWELLLDLPPEEVSRWLASSARQVWDRRLP